MKHNTYIGSNFGPNIKFPAGFDFDQRPQHYYKRFEGEDNWQTFDPCQFIAPNFFETITFEQLSSGNFDSGVRHPIQEQECDNLNKAIEDINELSLNKNNFYKKDK